MRTTDHICQRSPMCPPIAVFMLLGLTAWVGCATIASSPPAEEDEKWWNKQKIRFHWGQWDQSDRAGVTAEQLIGHLARVGATVFAETLHRYPDVPRAVSAEGGIHYHLETARLAHEQGMHYFASAYGYNIPSFMSEFGARPSMNNEGKPYTGREVFPCSLDIPYYQKWFRDPLVKLAKTGWVYGVQLDWEFYAGGGEAGVCYCDDCFQIFLKEQQIDRSLPDPTSRYAWLENQHLAQTYKLTYRRRRVEMFRQMANDVRRVRPNFMFSGYHMYFHPEIAAGLHSEEVPFMLLDSRHYTENQTRPWWDSYNEYDRSHGYMTIGGSWDHTMFGGQPESHVSLPQWLYETAMHRDGYWLWHEHEYTPDTWRSHWLANRRIAAVERKLGPILLNGERDLRFITCVEWTGSPELDRKIKHVTYHQDGRHLVHISNVDGDHPVQVRVRFAQLRPDQRWTIRDAMDDLYYSRDGDSLLWDTDHLYEGLIIGLSRRSDVFLLVEPVTDETPPDIDEAIIIRPAQFLPMPAHPRPEPQESTASSPGGNNRLTYLATKSLGYKGAMGGWATGNAIFSVQLPDDGQESASQELYHLKGHLWEPVWSPNGMRIAFTCYANGRGQIFTMYADGSHLRNLSQNAYCDRSPAWSPDSKKIAFTSVRDGDWEIYAMNADGSDPRRLTKSIGRDVNPVWSSPGTPDRIAFESDRGLDTDIFVMNADGSDQRSISHLPGHERFPAWSPDGREIAFSATAYTMRWLVVAKVDAKRLSGRDLAEMRRQYVRARGKFHRRITTTVNDIRHVSWSPDGQLIAAAFEGPQEQDQSGILTVKPDGEDLKYHVHVRAVHPHPSRNLWAGQKFSRHPRPTWYSTGSNSPRWVMKTFGGLSWSADSQRLAFSSDFEDGHFYVYILSMAEPDTPKRLDATQSAWLQSTDWCWR